MRIDARVPLSDLLPDWLQQPLLPIQIAKEVQALLPVWFLAWLVPCLLLALGFGERPDFFDEPPSIISAGLYFLFCAVMGGNIVGAEYTHRTLGQLLCQPVSRTRIWLRKMGVLAVALLTGGIPLFLFFALFESHFWSALAVVVAPGINAFCLGPWLSMKTRSALAGTVFSLAAPFLLLAGIRALSGFSWIGASELQQFGAFLAALLAMWCAGAALGYRAFLRLEALDARGTELHLPNWRMGRRERSAATSIHPGGWWRQLVMKEMRLQQVSFILAAVFWVGGFAYALGTRNQAAGRLDYFGPLVQMSSFMVALLTGALTCAEERQFGTLEWHLTSPVRSQTQWLIKVAVALSLSLLLAVILPAILLRIPLFKVAQDSFPMVLPSLAIFAGMMLSITTLAIYISSLSSSTVRALIAGATLAIACGALAAAIGVAAKSEIGRIISFFFWSVELRPEQIMPELQQIGGDLQQFARSAALLISGLTLGCLLWFGWENYRRADAGLARVGTQILVLSVLFWGATSFWSFAGNLN